MIACITALCNSVKLWAMPWGPPKMDGPWWSVLPEHTLLEKTGKSFQYPCLKNCTSNMKMQKYIAPEDESSSSVGVQYATWEREPKWKWYSAVDVSCVENKVWCCKERYSTGTWNVKFMNEGKWDMVKQDMMSEHQYLRNQWTKMDENCSTSASLTLVVWT